MQMNVLAAKACATAHECQPIRHHPGYAWIFALLFVFGITIYAISVIRRTLSDRAKPSRKDPESGEPGSNSQQDQKKKVPGQHTIYDSLQPRAKKVKAVLQMAIGIITVTAVGWRYFDTLGDGDPTSLFLNGIGIGLAAAAAIELAYTLFTDGPDEAGLRRVP